MYGLLADIFEFVRSLVMRISAWVTSGILAAFVFAYEHFSGHMVPVHIISVLLISFFCIAAFLSWRDEHRLVAGETARECFLRCLDIIGDNNAGVTRRLDLLKKAEAHKRIRSNQELVWVCRKLEKYGHGNPFGILVGYVPEGDWLLFLQQVTSKSINLENSTDAFYEAEAWRVEHGYPKPSGMPLMPPEQ